MTKQQIYLPVNWTDGMKINKTHLNAERNALQQQVVFSGGSHVSDVNYGLLPAVTTGQSPFSIFVSLDNQQYIKVRLINCRAITPGGVVIYADENMYGENEVSAKIPELRFSAKELKGKTVVFYVVLTVDVFNRVGTGIAGEQEIPPRLPFAAPQYSLSLVPQEELNGKKSGMYHVTLSRLLFTDNKVEVDEDYIPPCTCAASHVSLQDVFYGLEEFFSKMELYSIQIIQKIQQKKQTNEMALIVQKLCENVLQFLNTNFMMFKWMGMYQPPALMVSMAASLSRVIKNTLDMYVNTGKEELVNYFSGWCDINQATLEGVVVELGNHVYIHEDINGALVKATDFTKVISSLFYKLSRLDYIGKKRDANIFVKEEILNEKTAEAAVRKRRSFLAD